MQELKGGDSKENWLWKTYGQGILDARKLQPDRKFRLIHRYHQTGQSEIMEAFKDYTDPFELSFKYSIAHMYSIPNPPFIHDALPLITSDHRTWLTVRDDDIYSFRWGNPEFAREFIRNMPGPDKVAGFYMGPDGYVWGRDFLCTEPETPRELVISKRWYSFMLWGRLSYEPDLPDSLFQRTIGFHFPELAAGAPTELLDQAREFTAKGAFSKAEETYRSILKNDPTNVEVKGLLASVLFRQAKLEESARVVDSISKAATQDSHPSVPDATVNKMFQAWAEASKIFPQITRFFWGDIDVRWFPEACLSHPRGAQGFYTVKHFVEGETMPGSGVLNIIDWRRKRLSGQAMDGVTPLQIADALAGQGAKTLRMVAELRSPLHNQSKELRLTLGDLEAMAHLGNYYAEKIRGAADLALFDKSGKADERESAIRHLQAALDHWKRYATAYAIQYEQPKLYNRVGWVDIPGLTGKVEQDISIARLWAPGTEPDTPKQRRADTPFRK